MVVQKLSFDEFLEEYTKYARGVAKLVHVRLKDPDDKGRHGKTLILYYLHPHRLPMQRGNDYVEIPDAVTAVEVTYTNFAELFQLCCFFNAEAIALNGDMANQVHQILNIHKIEFNPDLPENLRDGVIDTVSNAADDAHEPQST